MSIWFLDEDKKILFKKNIAVDVTYSGFDITNGGQNEVPSYAIMYTDKDYDDLFYMGWYATDNAEYFQKVNSIKEDFYITDLENKKIVNFGDSLFGNYSGDTSISGYIGANLKNTNVVNAGFGGCRMSQRNDTTWNAFSMCNLADAICDNDWTLQDAAVNDETWSSMPSYFPTRLAALKLVNFNNVDLITIAYGTNDYTANVPLDNLSDLDDKSTLAGALRYTINKFQETFPDLRILVLSNTWRYFPNEDNITSDTKNYGNGTGIDYKNCILNTSKSMRIPCLDSY